MPETPITHEMLSAGQLVLIERFDRHEQQFRETTTKLFERVDAAIAASHENRLAIREVQMGFDGMLKARAEQLNRFETVERKVDVLDGDRHERKGERGVIAAIFRSPFFAWLSALAATAWGWFQYTGVKP